MTLLNQNYTNESTEYLRNKLDNLLEDSKFNEAEFIINELLSRDDSDLQALYAKGWFYVRKIDFKNAIKVYNNIIDIDPTDHKPYALLGEIYEHLAHNKQKSEIDYSKIAIDNYNIALQYDSMDTFSHIGLGRIYISIENWKEALRVLDEAINSDETNVEAWLYKSIALEKNGRLQDALEAIEEAKFRDPEDRRIIINEIWIKYQLLRIKEAIQLIEDALEIYPNDKEFLDLKNAINQNYFGDKDEISE